jgi:hypothetical protein
VSTSPPHPPTLLVTGATASIRGSINWSIIAAGKSGARIMTQSLAREFGPKGVHVGHAIIDGGIDEPDAAHAASNDATPDGKLSPYAVSPKPAQILRASAATVKSRRELKPWFRDSLFVLTFGNFLAAASDCRELLESAHAASISMDLRDRPATVQREVLDKRHKDGECQTHACHFVRTNMQIYSQLYNFLLYMELPCFFWYKQAHYVLFLFAPRERQSSHPSLGDLSLEDPRLDPSDRFLRIPKDEAHAKTPFSDSDRIDEKVH